VPPIEDDLGGSIVLTAKGKGLGAEKLIPPAALTGWAVDTRNKGPALRSEIVLFQCDEA
jgi:hypothetical protein